MHLSMNPIMTYFCFKYSDRSQGTELDPSLMRDLIGLFDEHNRLVKSFRMVCDFRLANENVPMKLRLFRNRMFDSRTYNVPEVSEIAALIVADFDDTGEGRDIVVKEKDGCLQCIHETHAKYIPL